MIDRRELLARSMSGALALSGLLGAQRPGGPAIRRPIPFNTPEADRILESLQVFPKENPWNQDIAGWPVHPNSRNIIASIGANDPLRYNPDMAFVLVPPDQRRVPVRVTGYPGESDPGPFPIPDEVPLEGWPLNLKTNPKLRGMNLDDLQRDRANEGGDRHAIVVDPIGGFLHEFWTVRRTVAGWEAGQASTFNLKTGALRPDDWTSADAAGLPIFPSIVRHDELRSGRIRHALRVTIQKTRRAYVHPATHYASQNPDPNLPRMGERLRLRAGFDVSRFSPPVRTILVALKQHGMLVADNGIDLAISVAPDERIPVLHDELRRVKGSDFEVVRQPASRGPVR